MRPERKAAAKTGRCKLCGGSGPLRNSHILPAWMYMRVGELTAAAGGGTNPVQIGDGRSMFDPRQLKDYLLCDGCELRFKVWEDYLHDVSLQNNERFVALEELRRVEDRFSDLERLLRSEGFTGELVSADASQLECDFLARVAVSVVWRASVSDKVEGVDLGPFEPSLAAYLLDAKAKLPDHTRVMVWFTTGRDLVDRAISHPCMRQVETFSMYDFCTFGMWFVTWIGHLPPWLDASCISTSRHAFVTDGHERRQGVLLLMVQRPPRGKLRTDSRF